MVQLVQILQMKMLNFNLENDRLRESEPGFVFNHAHKIATNFPKKFTPLRKKTGKNVHKT